MQDDANRGSDCLPCALITVASNMTVTQSQHQPGKTYSLSWAAYLVLAQLQTLIAVLQEQGRGRAQVLQPDVTHVTASAAADQSDCLACTAAGCSLLPLPAASSAARVGPALVAILWRCTSHHTCCCTTACSWQPFEQQPRRCQAAASDCRLPSGSVTTPHFSAQHAWPGLHNQLALHLTAQTHELCILPAWICHHCLQDALIPGSAPQEDIPHAASSSCTIPLLSWSECLQGLEVDAVVTYWLYLQAAHAHMMITSTQ